MGQQNLMDVDWSALPAPLDDGGARHLQGRALPAILLPATNGNSVNLSTLAGRSVIYVYPMTGRPGVSLPAGWDEMPGARGCTPQSCAFRDYFRDLKDDGAEHVFGLSSQDFGDQREAAFRLHLPFALLCDSDLAFARALSLPMFEVNGETFLKRLTIIVDDGRIKQVFYPVFPPDRNANEVLAWLRKNPK